MNHLAKLTLPILALAVAASIATGSPPTAKQTVIFVTQPAGACWQDFAFLAAIPASRMVNQGNGAVIVLDESGRIPREVDDYLRRLKPDGICHLGSKPLAAAPRFGKLFEMPCHSADEAANLCATTFWKNSNQVVLCRDDDYASALMASALAARLAVPLLFCGDHGLSPGTSQVIRSLQVRENLFVGKAPAGLKTTELPDIRRVLEFLQQQKLATPYLALVNVRDRNATTIRKLSLAAPIFAAAHGGMVVPFDAEIRWRVPFTGAPIKGDLPKGDLTVTTGSSDEFIAPLRNLYAATAIPRYLCIVGFPDALPQAILTNGDTDMTSDLPYANADDDLFSEIAVGRIIAENVTAATLHASRTITYESLIDPAWSSRAGQARWENAMGGNFENVGLDATAHHDADDLKWIEPPSGKNNNKGKREPAISQDSPLTSVAFMTHMAHSWWKDLGQTYDMDSSVLLAPTVIESGGCLTCALDNEPGFRSVIARLFRNGAVSFAGQTRPGIAQQEQQRLEFWNAILAGQTIGDAHRHAQNSKTSLVLETGQTRGGPDHYQLHIRSLFGDPAFKPRLPSPPRSAPAGVEVNGDTVTVHGPATWWKVQIRVPEDWKQWQDKPLYVLRGAGAYSHRSWCGEGYDKEEVFINAEVTTTRRIKSITQKQNPPAPLGWNGKHTVDENPDGSRTCRWRVRLVDFDQKTGVTANQLDRLDYQIEFEP